MIEATRDADAVNRILQSPGVVERLRHDLREPFYVEHPAVTWLSAKVEGEMVGVFTAIRYSTLEVDLHVAILPSAIRYARMLGHECLAHVFQDPRLMRATAYVLEGLESACNYCLKLGFRVEGFRRDAFLKDGKLIGVHVLGITRKDWESWAA